MMLAVVVSRTLNLYSKTVGTHVLDIRNSLLHGFQM